MIFSRSLFFVTILLLATITTSCQSKKSNSTSKFDNDREKELSISRKLFWDSLPKPTGYVNDYGDIYNDSEEKILSNLILEFDKKTTIQIAVVTFDTTMTSKDSLDALTLRIAKFWGVGQKGKDNGILIGICTGYRMMRIQNGYGIEKILTNDETKEIMEKIFFPGFRERKYYEATEDGLKALMEKLVRNMEKK